MRNTAMRIVLSSILYEREGYFSYQYDEYNNLELYKKTKERRQIK